MLALAWILLASGVYAQKREPVTTTGDSLAADVINGEPVEQIFNHMRFVQGPLYGSADKAVRYTKGHRLELIGNVEIHQDTLSLYAPYVVYDDSTGIGHAEGNVRLFDRDIELTAAMGDYDMNRQMANFHKHVTVTQGKTSSVSDHLLYYRSTQTSILQGNASVTSDSGSLTADTIIHLQALDETTAKGNVHLSNDSVRLVSDWFYDSKARGEMNARGHVSVEDIRNKTIIFGDTLARFAKTNFTIIPGRPLLYYIDSSQQRDSTGAMQTVFDTMFLRADTMKMYQGDSAHFVAIDSVRMLRSGFSLIGGRLVFDQVKDIINVFHSKRQRVWNDSTEIDADSVAMLMKDNHVKRVFAVGHAFATSPVDEFPNSGRVNQLEGESMMLVVEQDTARSLFDRTSALSIYFAVSDGKPDGVNRSSGDTIRIDFKNKSVKRLAILSGTEGEYFPERFIGARAAAYRLADYERHVNLRPYREEFVMPWLLPPPIPKAPETKSVTGSPIAPTPATDTPPPSSIKEGTNPKRTQ